MRIPLSIDAEGPFLMVAPEQGVQVIAALSLAGLRFSEGGPDGAGCAGPTLVVLRLEDDRDGLQQRVDAALAEF